MRFLSTLGLLPGTWVNLGLMVLSGLAEGFGLAMFLPLVQLIAEQDPTAIGLPFSVIIDAYRKLGLPVEPIVVLGGIAALVLGSLLLGYVQRAMLVRAKQLYAWKIRKTLVDSLLAAAWGHSSRRAHGEIVNHLVMECSRAGNALGHEVMAVSTATLIGVYVLFSIVISWQLTIIAAVFGGLAVFLLRPLVRRAHVLGDETNEANRTMTLYSVDYLRGLKLVKATATEDTVGKRLASRNTALFKVAYKSELNTTQVYFLVQALAAILLVLVIGIGYGAIGVPPALTLVFLMFLVRTAPRMAQFQQQYQSYILTSPALRVVREAVDAGEAAAETLNRGGARFERLERDLVLAGVSFSYPDGDDAAVDDISMRIARNQMVAIVGRSGAGKSTAIDLISGLYRPDAGSVRVDGTDLAAMDMVSWRRRIGFVSQDTVIFNDSLRNNLLLFHPDATPADIDRVLSIAHLEEVIAALPDGLDTMLGEGGVRLSGGQKQRVALARALVGRPELLLLDEATSALDNESERYVQQALETIKHTMTIVVIAHRLSTVRKADVIYVMEGGRIVEAGTHDELLANQGRFAELHQSQFA